MLGCWAVLGLRPRRLLHALQPARPLGCCPLLLPPSCVSCVLPAGLSLKEEHSTLTQIPTTPPSSPAGARGVRADCAPGGHHRLSGERFRPPHKAAEMLRQSAVWGASASPDLTHPPPELVKEGCAVLCPWDCPPWWSMQAGLLKQSRPSWSLGLACVFY